MVQPTTKRLVTEASVGGHVLTQLTSPGATKDALGNEISTQLTTPGTPASTALSATIGDQISAVAGVPAFAGKRTRRFDPATGAYNLTVANTRKLRAALGKARAGAQPVIACIGDSEMAGAPFPDSIPQRLTLGLAAKGIPVSGAYSSASFGPDDPRWVFSGFTGRSVGYRSWTAAGQAATFTSATAGTRMRLMYSDAGGAFTVAIDGGAAVTITPTGGSAIEVYTVNGLPSTTHTVVITAVGTAGAIFGISVDSASGLKIENLGQSGTQGLEWQPTGAWNNPYNIANYVLEGATPAATFCILGVNDLTATPRVTTAVYKDRITALRNSARFAGSDFIMMSTIQPYQASTTLALWEEYVSAMYDLADSLDIPLIDTHSTIFGSAAIAAINGLSSGDGTPHPSPAGYAAVAGSLLGLGVMG